VSLFTLFILTVAVSGVAPNSLSTSAIKKPLGGKVNDKNINLHTFPAPVINRPPTAATVLKMPHSRVPATSNQSISSDPGVVPRLASLITPLCVHLLCTDLSLE